MKQIFLFILITGFFVFGCDEPEKNFSIYTIGDSTMANKKEEAYPETGWCQVLQQYFDSTVTIKNYAAGGRSSKSFIDEGRWQMVLDSLKTNDYVFIQFGHNDEKKYDSTRYTTPFKTFSDNLEKFITESIEKGANPVLFTSIVRRKFGENGKLVDTHGDYPAATRKVAKDLSVPLIDLHELTKNLVNDLGEESSKSLYVWTEPDNQFPEGRKDNSHLSFKGANEVSILALRECIRQELGFANKIILIE